VEVSAGGELPIGTGDPGGRKQDNSPPKRSTHRAQRRLVHPAPDIMSLFRRLAGQSPVFPPANPKIRLTSYQAPDRLADAPDSRRARSIGYGGPVQASSAWTGFFFVLPWPSDRPSVGHGTRAPSVIGGRSISLPSMRKLSAPESRISKTVLPGSPCTDRVSVVHLVAERLPGGYINAIASSCGKEV
jgi:hypothetical protein